MALYTQAEIADFSGDELDADERLYCCIITDETLEVIAAQCETLTEAHRKHIRAYMRVWEATPDETVEVHPAGSDGTNYSQERDRLDAAQRMRLLFGLPGLAEEALKRIAARVRAYKGAGAPDPFGLGAGAVSSSVYTRAVF